MIENNARWFCIIDSSTVNLSHKTAGHVDALFCSHQDNDSEAHGMPQATAPLHATFSH